MKKRLNIWVKMKKFKLKVPKYSFDHEGMIIRGEKLKRLPGVRVYARDICSDNMNTMSKMNIKDCMEYGSNCTWNYELDRLEPLETIKITRLDYEMLKFIQKQGAKYICRDKNGLINLYEKEPCIMSDDCTWVAGGQCSYFGKFTKQLFQFVKWEDKKYYVIEYVLNNCEVVEDVD